jgi:hypothetical protein
MSFSSVLPDITSVLVQIGSVTTAMSGETGLVAVGAGLIGGFFIAQAVYRAYHMAQPQGGGHQGGIERIVIPLFFGVLLLNFWVAQQQIAGQLALTGGALSPTMPQPYLQQAWDALKTVSKGYGTIMVFRGLLLAKSLGDGGNGGGHNNPAWGALWHIVGGILLMNT